jgi:hypothetical protein
LCPPSAAAAGVGVAAAAAAAYQALASPAAVAAAAAAKQVAVHVASQQQALQIPQQVLFIDIFSRWWLIEQSYATVKKPFRKPNLNLHRYFILDE